MLIAFHRTSVNKNQTFIAPCIDYLNHFTSLREQQTAYQDKNSFITIRSQTPLYSYYLPNAPILSGPLITYQLHYEFLQTQLREQISIFNQKWYQLLTTFRRLKTIICTYIRSQDIYLFHLANRQHRTRTFYTFEQNANLITYYRRTTNSLSQTIATLYTILDDPLTTLAQQAKRIYALRFATQYIEHLRNSPYLYSNTIYRHYHTYKSFSSTAILSVIFPTPISLASTVFLHPITNTQTLSSLETRTTSVPATTKPLLTNFTNQTNHFGDLTTHRTPLSILNSASNYTSHSLSDTTHDRHLTKTAAHSTKPTLISSPNKQPILLSNMPNSLSQQEPLKMFSSTLPNTFTLSSKHAFIIAYPILQCPIPF